MEGVREGPEEGTLGASVLFCSISVIVVWNVLSWGDENPKIKGAWILVAEGSGMLKTFTRLVCASWTLTFEGRTRARAGSRLRGKRVRRRREKSLKKPDLLVSEAVTLHKFTHLSRSVLCL